VPELEGFFVGAALAELAFTAFYAVKKDARRARVYGTATVILIILALTWRHIF